jgi:hypothetical protein
MSPKVFAPSGMCFNAITFVIQAWQSYSSIFESLTGLLGRCVAFLNRVVYYVKGGMDVNLAKVAAQHLQLFVEICDRSIKLRHSKRSKLMAFTKVFFLNDTEIQGLLDMMQSLADEEGHLVAAQTFNFSSEAAVNSRENLEINRKMDGKVDMLVEDKMDQKKEQDAQKRRELILRKLAFEDDKMDKDKKEPSASWKTRYNNYRNTVVKNTGDWIFEHLDFIQWESGHPTSKSILAVEGFEGSGKSFLASSIIRHLQSRVSVDGKTPLTAFYFLEADSKEGAKKSNSLDIISKSLVWQFTQADAVYQKSVASICEKVKELDPPEVWTQLLAENKDRSKIDVVFFVVIDGLGDSIEEPFIDLLRTVAADPEDRDIRVLLTGTPRSFEILETAQGLEFDTLKIDSNNEGDIEKYIDSKMDSIETLKDVTRVEILPLRKKIRDSLKAQTEGDFFKLDSSLNKIGFASDQEEIDEILENAGRERSEQIIADIDRLNKTRTPKEIAEINEILLWIIEAYEWLDPRRMDAVLYLKSGTSSLLSLETKLKTKYTLFKVDSYGDVIWKSPDIVDYLTKKDSMVSDNESSHSKEVQPAEVAIVEHFLNTVCPPELYAKFGFEEFFRLHKTGRGNNYIHQDVKNNAIKLLLTCLQILTRERDDKLECVPSFLCLKSPIHL